MLCGNILLWGRTRVARGSHPQILAPRMRLSSHGLADPCTSMSLRAYGVTRRSIIITKITKEGDIDPDCSFHTIHVGNNGMPWTWSSFEPERSSKQNLTLLTALMKVMRMTRCMTLLTLLTLSHGFDRYKLTNDQDKD